VNIGEKAGESRGFDPLPGGTAFESVDSKQEVACVRDHLPQSCENSQEGYFFPLEWMWGGREDEQWKNLSPKEQRCQGSYHDDSSKLDFVY
jgi:hypothetical protein